MASARVYKAYERTWRRNGKWSKLCRRPDGSYHLANGFHGEIKARHTYEFTSYSHATTYRDSWLDDDE